MKTETVVFVVVAALAAAVIVNMPSCTQADVVSANLSKAADAFQIDRRIVFYNTHLGTYMLEIRGRCSLGNNDKQRQLSVTCKVGPMAYKKHYLGLVEGVTFFVEQMAPAVAGEYNYRVVFNPRAILPDIQFLEKDAPPDPRSID